MEYSEKIKSIKLFLFDMDGTLYIGEKLFSFTKELLKVIRQTGRDYLFVTNNSSRSVEDTAKKLVRLGVEAESGDFFTSSQATIHYLKNNMPNAVLYVGGTKSLAEELRKGGFAVSDNLDEVTCIVMGNDTELTFKKLDDISRLLLTKNVSYIATNPDLVCPTEYGSVPDCGSVCQMIYNATGKKPVFIGKPEPLMIELAMKLKGVKPEETAVVGDRIYTDIKSGINAGAVTILVMSGETTEKILSESTDKPDIVMNSGEEILNILKTEINGEN
jgi:HAD superfamily hydrolase (TIGR01457 family)